MREHVGGGSTRQVGNCTCVFVQVEVVCLLRRAVPVIRVLGTLRYELRFISVHMKSVFSAKSWPYSPLGIKM